MGGKHSRLLFTNENYNKQIRNHLKKSPPRKNVAYLFETSDSGVPRLVWSSSKKKNIEPSVSHVLLS
jgi:hypothetical protein